MRWLRSFGLGLLVAWALLLASPVLSWGQTCPSGTTPTFYGQTRDQDTDEIRQVFCMDRNGRIIATVKMLNNIRFVDPLTAGDVCAKISAAIADLLLTGGIVDARGFEGIQPCAGGWTQNGKIQVLLGAVTIRPGTDIVLSSNQASIVGIGKAATYLQPLTGAEIKISSGYTGGDFILRGARLAHLGVSGIDTNGVGVHVINSLGVILEDVQFSSFTTSNGALWLDDQNDGFIENGIFDVGCSNNTVCVHIQNSSGTSASYEHNQIRIVAQSVLATQKVLSLAGAASFGNGKLEIQAGMVSGAVMLSLADSSQIGGQENIIQIDCPDCSAGQTNWFSNTSSGSASGHWQITGGGLLQEEGSFFGALTSQIISFLYPPSGLLLGAMPSPVALNSSGDQFLKMGVSDVKIVADQATLSGGTVTVTFIKGFTAAGSYKCGLANLSNQNALKLTRVSATQITITSPGATDAVDFVCVGN